MFLRGVFNQTLSLYNGCLLCQNLRWSVSSVVTSKTQIPYLIGCVSLVEKKILRDATYGW